MNSFLILSRLQSGTEEVVRLDEALAAIAAEREACAKVCEDLDIYEPEIRQDCADAIRRRSNI